RPPAAPLFPYTTLFRSLRADPAAAVRDLAALQHADPAAADPAAEDAAQRRGPGKGAVSRARYLEHREPDPARVDARAHEPALARSEEHTSELQSLRHLV